MNLPVELVVQIITAHIVQCTSFQYTLFTTPEIRSLFADLNNAALISPYFLKVVRKVRFKSALILYDCIVFMVNHLPIMQASFTTLSVYRVWCKSHNLPYSVARHIRKLNIRYNNVNLSQMDYDMFKVGPVLRLDSLHVDSVNSDEAMRPFLNAIVYLKSLKCDPWKVESIYNILSNDVLATLEVVNDRPFVRAKAIVKEIYVE